MKANRYRLVVSFDGGNYARVETYKDMDEREAVESLVEALDVPLGADGKAYSPTEDDVAKALGGRVEPGGELCRAETARQRSAYEAYAKLAKFVASGETGESSFVAPDPMVPGASTTFAISTAG